MGQVLIRNVDDRVIAQLKQRADRERRSLEQTLRDILSQAAEPSRADLLARIDALRNGMGPISGDATALVREDRDNNERPR